jgi:hypothetical protein
VPPEPTALLDVENETQLPLSRASRHPLLNQRGRAVARGTLERWRTKGVLGPGGKRVVLETALVGGTRVTTVEAVRRFLARLNGVSISAPSSTAMRRQHDRAEAELQRAGI